MTSDVTTEERMVLWDRLVRGEEVDAMEIGDLIPRLAHDASDDERSACVLLLASVHVASRERRAMRRNLCAALRYWFSQSGSEDRPDNVDPDSLRNVGLESIVGLRLRWPEAMRSVGANPNDYSALKRIEKRLREQCVIEWERLFNCAPPTELSERG